jgi:membrane-associated phospholipid phosphatase
VPKRGLEAASLILALILAAAGPATLDASAFETPFQSVQLTSTAGGSAPATLTPVAGAERPFFGSTLWLIADYGASPLNLRWNDLLWLAPSAAAVALALRYDLPVYDAIATGSGRDRLLDHSMPAISAVGDGLMEAGLVALAAKWGPPRLARTSAVALQALAVAGVYSEALKYAAWSNRPYEDPNGHYFWDFSQDTQGMPSGHTFSAFAVAEVYGAEYGRYWTYPLAALVGYSRIYNQQHWPSDVVAGAVLGIADGVQARRAAELGGYPDLHFGFAMEKDTPLLVAHAQF